VEAQVLYLYLYKKPPIKIRLWEPEGDPNLVTLEDIYIARVVTEIVRFDSLIGCY
jgi:hypothetical protein